MTPRNAAEVALGVAGIYFLAEHVPAAILTLVSTLEEHDQVTWLRWVGFAQVLLMLAAGFSLFWFRAPFAACLTRHMETSDPQTVAPGVHAAAVSVLGLFFFVSGVSSLLGVAAVAREQMPFSKTGFSATPFIQPGTQTLLGAALFLGTRGIVRVWTTLRTAGRHHDGDAA
ncbi:MAG TPA: hypothetical protein VHE30_03980 [Polyangiaceae bacterium]|nr:hypothetical protein [Polyangiaceae bacterium]